MKIEFELHDSRKERPEKSCDVLVLVCDSNGDLSYADKVPYSKKHDQFLNHDSMERDIIPAVETNGYFALWAYFDDVQKAIKEAEKPVETCRERLKRKHPECIDRAYIGGCYGCPIDYGYAGYPDDCFPANDCCSKCWDRPVEEKDNG